MSIAAFILGLVISCAAVIGLWLCDSRHEACRAEREEREP